MAYQAVLGVLDAAGVHYTVTATTPTDPNPALRHKVTTAKGGRSEHADGWAVDITGDLDRAWDVLLPYARVGLISELFYDPRGGYDKGISIGPIGGHGGHLHASTPLPSLGPIPSEGGQMVAQGAGGASSPVLGAAAALLKPPSVRTMWRLAEGLIGAGAILAGIILSNRGARQIARGLTGG